MRARRIAAALSLAGWLAAGVGHAGDPAPPAPSPVLRAPDPATMAAYQLALIRRGPLWSAKRSAHQDSVMSAHGAVIRGLETDGLLLGAATVVGNRRWHGVLIFKDVAQDSLASRLRADPAFRTATLLVELHRWLAPRGLGEARAERARLRPGAPDSMVLVPVALLEKPSFLPPLDEGTRREITAKHQGRILDLMLDGRLLAAGPCFDDGDLREVGFFGTDTTSARRILNQDAAVAAGRLLAETMVARLPWGLLPPRPAVREAAR